MGRRRISSCILSAALAAAILVPLGTSRAAPAEAAPAEIDAAAAARIALERVPGTVEEIERDHKRGRAVFEVEVRDRHGVKYEVIVDAHNGSILDVRPD